MLGGLEAVSTVECAVLGCGVFDHERPSQPLHKPATPHRTPPFSLTDSPTLGWWVCIVDMSVGSGHAGSADAPAVSQPGEARRRRVYSVKHMRSAPARMQ